MANDSQGMNLPLPPKSWKPDAHDGGPMKNAAGGRATVQRYSSETKSPAKAERVVDGLCS